MKENLGDFSSRRGLKRLSYAKLRLSLQEKGGSFETCDVVGEKSLLSRRVILDKLFRGGFAAFRRNPRLKMGKMELSYFSISNAGRKKESMIAWVSGIHTFCFPFAPRGVGRFLAHPLALALRMHNAISTATFTGNQIVIQGRTKKKNLGINSPDRRTSFYRFSPSLTWIRRELKHPSRVVCVRTESTSSIPLIFIEGRC